MKKTAAALVLLAAASAFALAGCEQPTEEVPAIRDIQISPSSVTVAPGGTADLSVSITADGDLGSVSVQWTSGNASVATVEATGDGGTARVTGQSEGTTTVTATVTTEAAGVVDEDAQVTVTGG